MQTPRQTVSPSKRCAATWAHPRRLRMDTSPELFSIFPISVRATMAVASIAAFGTISAFAQSSVTTVMLDKMNVGAPPSDFEFSRTGQGGPARWVVVDDRTAATGRAIEQ